MKRKNKFLKKNIHSIIVYKVYSHPTCYVGVFNFLIFNSSTSPRAPNCAPKPVPRVLIFR